MSEVATASFTDVVSDGFCLFLSVFFTLLHARHPVICLFIRMSSDVGYDVTLLFSSVWLTPLSSVPLHVSFVITVGPPALSALELSVSFLDEQYLKSTGNYRPLPSTAVPLLFPFQSTEPNIQLCRGVARILEKGGSNVKCCTKKKTFFFFFWTRSHAHPLNHVEHHLTRARSLEVSEKLVRKETALWSAFYDPFQLRKETAL